MSVTLLPQVLALMTSTMLPHSKSLWCCQTSNPGQRYLQRSLQQVTTQHQQCVSLYSQLPTSAPLYHQHALHDKTSPRSLVSQQRDKQPMPKYRLQVARWLLGGHSPQSPLDQEASIIDSGCLTILHHLKSPVG